MEIKNIIKTASFVAVVSFSGLSIADNSTGPYVSIGENWFKYDNKRLIDDDNSLYLTLGYQSSPNIGLEFKYTDAAIEYMNVSGVYRFTPRTESSFYLKAGLGKYDNNDIGVGSTTGNNFNIGGGYEAYFTDSLSANIGIDGIYQPDGDRTDYVPYVGLTYFFGSSNQSKPKPILNTQKAPLDSDKDGVYDNVDQCLNSPLGVKVSTNGCELDSDQDGIVDSQDKCLNTPLAAKVDADGCRILLTKDVSIKLNVQFANNSNNINDQYRAEIEKVADFMKQYPDTKVVIEGHTDSIGAASYNKALSQKRADAVAKYLTTEFEIDSNRVSAEGKGEVSPVTTNDTPEGRAENRRVQAEIKTSTTNVN